MLFQFVYFPCLAHRMPLIPYAACSKYQRMCFIRLFTFIGIRKRMNIVLFEMEYKIFYQ